MMRPTGFWRVGCIAVVTAATSHIAVARVDLLDGTFLATQVDTVATGRTCEIGAPLKPAFVLVAGPTLASSAYGAVAMLRDDAGLALPLLQADDATTFDLGDPTADPGATSAPLGTVRVVGDASGLVLEVAYRRPVPDCRVGGRVTLERTDDGAASADVVRIAAALALARRRDRLADEGKWREALEPALAVEAQLAEVLGQTHPLTLVASTKIAQLQWQLDELPAARERYERAREALTEALGADAYQVLQTRHDLALVLWYQGDVDTAEREMRDVLQRYATLIDADDITRVSAMSDLGSLLAQRGRLAEAERLMFDVLARLERTVGPEHPRSLVALNNLAVMLDNGGRLDESLPMYATLVARYERTVGRRHPHALYALLNQADTLGRLGRYEEAIPIARDVLEGTREVLGARHTDALLAQNNLAHLLAEHGRIDEALALQQDVVALREGTDGARSREALKAHVVLGGLELKRGDKSAGLDRMARAHADAKVALGEREPTTLEIGARLAAAQREAGSLDAARDTLVELVDRLEAWRESGATTADTRRALFAPWAASYKSLAAVHLATGDVPAAFAQSERSKARVLVEVLAQRRAQVRDVLPADALDRLAKLDRELADAEAQIARTPDPSARLPLELARIAIADQGGALREDLRKQYPKYAALSHARILPLAESAREIPSRSVFVSYLRDGDRVVAFTLDRRGRLSGRDLGIVPGLDDIVTAYRTLLAAPLEGRARPVWKLADGRYRIALVGEPGATRITDPKTIGATLFARLIQPLPELLRARRWIVSPDGALAVLPFEALPHRGRPLIATREISYTPSLTVFALTAQRGREYDRRAGRAPLYAMGAAQYDDVAPAASAATRRSGIAVAQLEAALAEDPPGLRRAYEMLGPRWTTLPQSEAEIHRVAAQFRRSGKVTVRRGTEATEARLQADDRDGTLAAHRYVLLSAHGFLSTEAPSLSAVVLGQRDLAPGTDGYVTAAEWTGYTLRSDLIVISACETGVGKVIEGEGVAGLPYALFVAGNRNALLTLWPVADQSTALFVSRFFGRLQAGLSQSAALTQTKREFMSGRRHAAPVHWAPFVLWGA